MDIPGLAALLAVADAGSFSRAAERLHLSQPAVSKRIAQLEAETGATLFDRVGRRVLLTTAGSALLPHARRVLQDLEDGQRALSHLGDGVAGQLSLGTSHHIGLHRLAPVLRRFVQRFPAADLDLQFMDSEVACQAVRAGDLELGVVTLPPDPDPLLDLRPVWVDPLTVVVSPVHPLGHRRMVRLDELATHPAVLPDASTFTHRIVREALREHGIEPRVRLATNYLETLKMLVSTGLGWSVLPRTMVDASLRALSTRGFAPHRTLGVVRHRRRSASAAAEAFVSLLPQRGRARATR